MSHDHAKNSYDGKWGREIRAAELVVDEHRQLRTLLYKLTPVEMLKVVMEVIARQTENARRGKG